MAKKRKALATSLDEVDRTMYSTFCSAANSLSQLYTHAMNQQKLTFVAGERHGLEKLFQWISRQHGGGLRVTTEDVLAYIQAELDNSVEESSISPVATQQNQHSQAIMQLPNSNSSISPAAGLGFRPEPSEQLSKSYVFSNALSSPVRCSLQSYHISQEGYSSSGIQPSANGIRNTEANFAQHQNRDYDPSNSDDASMDMHADTGDHGSAY